MKFFTAALLLSTISCMICIQSCSRTGSEEVYIQYTEALRSYMDGHNDQALHLLETLLTDSPGFTEASLLYGRVLFYSELYSESASCLETALTEEVNLDSSKILARSYLMLSKAAAAEAYLDEALKYSSGDPELLYLKARCRIESDDPEAALALLTTACTYMERQIEIPLALASLYSRYGLNSEAAELVEQYESLLKEEHPLKSSLKNLKSKYEGQKKTGP